MASGILAPLNVHSGFMLPWYGVAAWVVIQGDLGDL
jgi:hypothetical protein